VLRTDEPRAELIAIAHLRPPDEGHFTNSAKLRMISVELRVHLIAYGRRTRNLNLYTP